MYDISSFLFDTTPLPTWCTATPLPMHSLPRTAVSSSAKAAVRMTAAKIAEVCRNISEQLITNTSTLQIHKNSQ